MRYFISPHQEEVKGLRRASMDALKCHVPPFTGARDLEMYLDWEMKLYHYACMDDVVHQAIQVEVQYKRRLTSKRTYSSGPNN
ncbi:hypothetical protein CR513_31575, partial [Mucuna pruriens]